MSTDREAAPGGKEMPHPSKCRNGNCGQWVDNCDYPDCCLPTIAAPEHGWKRIDVTYRPSQTPT